MRKKPYVALFTGAWIEILVLSGHKETRTVALFTGAWIEIIKGLKIDFIDMSRALYGRVD